MTKDEAKLRIEALRAEITKHDRLYDKMSPIITDSEYDILYRELVSLESEYPEFYDSDSPTQRIVTETVEGLEKVRHPRPMLSLDKETTDDGLRRFCKCHPGKILVQEKLDGLTIVLTYEGGVLVDAVTRGNGIVGERVLHTIKTIRNVPKRITHQGRLVVRCEAIIPFSEFERINTDGAYSNTRNLVSGTVRQLDAAVAASRRLSVIAYDIIEAEGQSFRKDSERLEYMKALGFDVVWHTLVADAEEIILVCREYAEKKRATLDYAIDGLVAKFDDLDIREELGETSKAPRWAIAWKFSSQDATTTLRNVVWQVGRTGQVTPVAEFDEIDIDGVRIRRASLHNYQNIIDKDIRIGDVIVVARANDVIPQVIQSVKSLRSGSEQVIPVPAVCPDCGSPVELKGPMAFCTGGSKCREQAIGKLIHFCKRDAMDIQGLGDNNIGYLFDKGYLRSIPDLYRLGLFAVPLSDETGFGKAKVKNILDAIEKSKSQPLSALLYGLSIPNIGKSNAKALARHAGKIEALLYVTADKLVGIEGFGDTMIQAVVDYFADSKNISDISALKAFGVNTVEPMDAPMGDALVGKTFVITGTLSKERGHFEALIQSLGGKCSGSVSKKTDYLLMGAGADGSSKHQKAVELGIRIISEPEFEILISK